MRTNIDIDDKLMKQAMKASEETTKKAVVEKALRLMVQLKAQEGMKKLRGKIVWRGPDDDWFASDEEILARRTAERQKSAAGQRKTRELSAGSKRAAAAGSR